MFGIRNIGREIGKRWGVHIRKKHKKGKEKWTKCYICLTGYSFYVSLPILISWAAIRIAETKKVKINIMNETLIYLLVLLGLLLVPLVSILLNYYFERKKLAAETKKIQLQNKITEQITYDQLKTESKQKDIKGKIEILSRITKLENEIKNKENKTASDQKKLESLEMIKKEFKEIFVTETKLMTGEKKIEAEKTAKKAAPAKINLKKKKGKKH